jgi:acetyl esterase/lipase
VPKPTTGVTLIIETYKTIDDTQLKAHIFLPPGFAEMNSRPAFVFFHGGGWYEGQPENGYRLCRHFAELGMVAIAFEYRLADQDAITPVECIMDAKSAIRWTRQHAHEWGIDPDKIVATGGSAGGHLAVSTAVLEGFEESEEDASTSSSPNALVVWSAPVNVIEDSWFVQLLGERADGRDCSPVHHVRPGLPPMALLHGTADETVPYWTVEDFGAKMREAGNRCEIYPYKGAGHLFHQANHAHFLSVIEEFLVSLGYIDDRPDPGP